MKRLLAICSLVLLLSSYAAGVSIVKNGSFENDGQIDSVTNSNRPQYWCDVDYDQSKFAAYIGKDWSPDSNFSLTIFASYGSFLPNDAAMISQSVFLADTKQILFNLRLTTDYDTWNPDKVTARVFIDGQEVWNSDDLDFSAGWFEGEVAINVDESFKDDNPHIVSFGITIDDGNLDYVQYFSQWDFVRLSINACSVPDFTGDCKIDINDIDVFANGWLEPNDLDLTGDNSLNFVDFAFLAESWGLAGDTNNVLPPEDDLLDGDLNDDGIVNYEDLVILAGGWLSDGGPCIRGDVNEDGVIDFYDFAKLSKNWMLTGSLYGW